MKLDLVNDSLTIRGNPRRRGIGEKEIWSAMNGKTAWILSAKAFEASRNERFPRLARSAVCHLGVALFWTALALEGRAFEVWRELRAQKPTAQRWSIGAIRDHCVDLWGDWVDRLREIVWRRGKGECLLVPAWSLPDSRKIRGLGLGRMWAVLCPFCHEFHTHSPGDGRRTPHCCSSKDRNLYILEFDGLLPAEHRARFHRSSRAGLPRLLHQWAETACENSETVELLAA